MHEYAKQGGKKISAPSIPIQNRGASFFLKIIRFIAPPSGRLGLDKTVNDRIKEDSADANAAPEQFHEVERLAEHEGYANDDDDALCSVCHRLSHGILRMILIVRVKRRELKTPNDRNLNTGRKKKNPFDGTMPHNDTLHSRSS